jgi:hypothetical protein
MVSKDFEIRWEWFTSRYYTSVRLGTEENLERRQNNLNWVHILTGYLSNSSLEHYTCINITLHHHIIVVQRLAPLFDTSEFLGSTSGLQIVYSDRSFVVFVSPSKQMVEKHRKIGHDFFT